MGRARLETNRVFYAAAGKRICDVRNSKRVTQERLAFQVSLTRTSIINIEKGRQQILLHTLVEIARALGVEVSDLLPEDVHISHTPDLRAYRSRKKVHDWVETGLKKMRAEGG
jgi:transcriptional regulator with XRE-family HTH domain